MACKKKLYALNPQSAPCLIGTQHTRRQTRPQPADPKSLERAVRQLLAAHTTAQAQQLQIGLGKLRRASHHFQGRLLALDPHRLLSYSQRHVRLRRLEAEAKPAKTVQTFFNPDAQTNQPVAFTLGSAACTVAQVTPELLGLAQAILNPSAEARPLVVADCEHYDSQLLDWVQLKSPFDLLVPMRQSARRRAASPPLAFPVSRPSTPDASGELAQEDQSPPGPEPLSPGLPQRQNQRHLPGRR